MKTVSATQNKALLYDIISHQCNLGITPDITISRFAYDRIRIRI